MFTLQWVGVSDPDMLRRVFHSKQMPPTGFNRGYFTDPEVDRLIDEATVSTDDAERRRLYGRTYSVSSPKRRPTSASGTRPTSPWRNPGCAASASRHPPTSHSCATCTGKGQAGEERHHPSGSGLAWTCPDPHVTARPPAVPAAPPVPGHRDRALPNLLPPGRGAAGAPARGHCRVGSVHAARPRPAGRRRRSPTSCWRTRTTTPTGWATPVPYCTVRLNAVWPSHLGVRSATPTTGCDSSSSTSTSTSSS